MSHKVHPKAFRIKETADWQSRWFERKNYQKSLQEDFLIREFLKTKLKDASMEGVEIERFSGKIIIIVSSARPGIIIGRGGAGIEELKKAIERILKIEKQTRKNDVSTRQEVRLEIKEIKNPWESAPLTAQWIAQQLEKRMPYRKVMKQSMGKVMANKDVKGVKVEIAGRLGGADIARKESLRMGNLPLQTLRANIDYSLQEAKTTYGMIGVKVWMYRGEKFE